MNSKFLFSHGFHPRPIMYLVSAFFFPLKHLKKKSKMFFGTCARMIHRCDILLSFRSFLGSSLKIHIHRVCVHPLGLSKQEECAEPNAVHSCHQVENRNPGASGLNQVSSQVHTNHTCREGGRENAKALAWILPCAGRGKEQLQECTLPRRAPPVFATPGKKRCEKKL